MKKFTLQLFVFALLLISTLHAQVPQRFNYQGIARDAKGNPMAGQTLSLKISLLPTADAPEAEYEEIQTVSTNAFGLYTLQIGNGSPTKGEMKAVKWESGNKYIRVAIDPKGGSDFADAGTTQLLSVPYALYAERAGSAKNNADRLGNVSSNATHVAGDANYLTKFTALNVIGKSQIFDNGTNVGIGTNAPASTASLHIRRSTAGQYLYLQNTTANSSGSFRLYNDVATNFATFTKYGSAVTGGYTGIADKYPYANILGFGNNGAVLNASTGNIGLAITKAGTNKLKFHIDAATERIGLGGNAVPAAPVHFNNTNGSNDTLKFTNNTTGHTAADGLEIRTNGNAAQLINRENDALTLGTNNTDRLTISGSGNVGMGTSAPTAKLDVNGQIRIQGGNPGPGKVLTSDSLGLASWQQAPQGGGSFWAASANNVYNTNAGSVGIGTNAPHPSAMAEINSVSKGLLPPRMTDAQRQAIAAPADGLMIFNTSTGCPNYFYSGNWYENCGNLLGAISQLNCNGATTTGCLFAGAVLTINTAVYSAVPYSGGNGGSYLGQTVNSIGVTGLTATIQPGSFNYGSGYLQFTITGTASSAGTANFVLYFGGVSCTLQVQFLPGPPQNAPVYCNGLPTAVVDVLNPLTGKTWMDRNLGATQAASSSADSLAFGDLYQWGRGSDGHQCRNSATTATLSSCDQPGHGNFIVTNAGPSNWRDPGNITLWQGVNGINNPCPAGYRIPSVAELEAERVSWSSPDASGAWAAPLKWSMAGFRAVNGIVYSGSARYYSSYNINNDAAVMLLFNNLSSSANSGYLGLANGCSIRCIKN